MPSPQVFYTPCYLENRPAFIEGNQARAITPSHHSSTPLTMTTAHFGHFKQLLNFQLLAIGASTQAVILGGAEGWCVNQFLISYLEDRKS